MSVSATQTQIACTVVGCDKPATTSLPNRKGEIMFLCDYHVGEMIAWVILEEHYRSVPPEDRESETKQ